MKQAYQYSALLGIVSLLTTGLQAGDETVQAKSSNPSSDWANSSGIVGHFGLSTGANFLRGGDGVENSARVGFGVIDGSITIPVFQKDLLTLDAYARKDKFESDSDFDSAEGPKSEFSLGAHYLRQITEDTRAGFFAAYSDTRPQDGDKSDAYNLLIYGLEAHHFLSDDLMLYGQFGSGFKLREGAEDENGFDNGIFVRAGASYFPDKISSITLDVELAYTGEYIDGDAAGHFYGTTLSYQRLITDDMPLYFTCFGRYDVFESPDDDAFMDEFQVGIGFRYYFGAESPQGAARKGLSIGTPRLPTRASAWTQALD